MSLSHNASPRERKRLFNHNSEDSNYKQRNNRAPYNNHHQQYTSQTPQPYNNHIHNTTTNKFYNKPQQYYGSPVYSPFSPSIDENKSVRHTHNHNNHSHTPQHTHSHTHNHMSLLNMGHSTPNIHHTNHHKDTNSYHNRHSNPPKHHPHGLLTNRMNSPSPQTQLKQLKTNELTFTFNEMSIGIAVVEDSQKILEVA
eukprot:365448_1